MINTAFRKMPDGTIIFIRGLPPLEVAGYEADEGDPMIFRPIAPPCQRKVVRLVVLPKCKKQVEKFYCDKLNLFEPMALFCQNCDQREPPPSSHE